MRGFRKTHSAIVCDPGGSAIRAVQLCRKSGAIALHDSLALDVPHDSAAAGESKAVAENITRAMNQGAFAGREMALVLSPPDVRFTSLKVAESVLSQPTDRLHAALAFEMAREVRAEPADLEVRYWRLPPGHQQELNIMAVSVGASRATDWFTQLRRSRVSLSHIDVSPCAAVRLATQFWTPGKRDIWGILDLGRFQTTLTVVLDQTPTYIRSLAVSSEHWTKLLTDAFDVSPEEGERIKRASGIAASNTIDPVADASPLAGDADDGAGPVVFRLLRESMDTLVRDIDLCFSYVAQSYADVNVARLLLVGGAAELRGLDEYLGLHLSVPVQRLCTSNSDVTWERPLQVPPFGCASAVAMGAALLNLEAA